jgi:hypothetical protein
MMITSYDPWCRTNCPQCRQVTDCDMLSGQMWQQPWRFTVRCRTCQHTWTFHLPEVDP